MEILVRIVDKGPNDDHSKRGDVIAICPDGWGWSVEERTNSFWRIIRAPILGTHAAALLSMPNPDSVSSKWRRREWTIDFSKLPNPGFFDGERTQDIIELTRAQVQAASSRKP